MELHKQWIKVDLIEKAREDVLKNRSKSFAEQNRINLAEIESEAISEISRVCGALAWFNYQPTKSGAQIHEPASKGKSDQTWHQDISALGGMSGCTVWVPLDPIDGTRPSLMFAGEKVALPHYHDERAFSVAESPYVDAATVILKMDLGDIAVFNWNELHCTYWDAHMVNGRISLDLRYRNV